MTGHRFVYTHVQCKLTYLLTRAHTYYTHYTTTKSAFCPHRRYYKRTTTTRTWTVYNKYKYGRTRRGNGWKGRPFRRSAVVFSPRVYCSPVSDGGEHGVHCRVRPPPPSFGRTADGRPRATTVVRLTSSIAHAFSSRLVTYTL